MVILFTTSNRSGRTVPALKKILKDKGIIVTDDYFYAYMLNIGNRTAAAETFGAKKRN